MGKIRTAMLAPAAIAGAVGAAGAVASPALAIGHGGGVQPDLCKHQYCGNKPGAVSYTTAYAWDDLHKVIASSVVTCNGPFTGGYQWSCKAPFTSGGAPYQFSVWISAYGGQVDWSDVPE